MHEFSVKSYHIKITKRAFKSMSPGFLSVTLTLCLHRICVAVFTSVSGIDLKLRNKSHGPMHYIIGVTCVYNGHVFNTLL